MYWKRGTVIGDRYEIIDILGQGAFGITFKAKHRQLDAFCVIKSIGPWVRKQPNYDRFVQQFRKEGRRLAELAQQKPHPHIVRVFDLFQEEDTAYSGEIDCMVMEFIPGRDLYKGVVKGGKLPEAEAVHYVQQIGDALIEVHKRGLVHWDVTPLNIMIRPDKEAVLIDFGIAGDCPPSSFSKKFGNEVFAPYEQLLKRVREKQCDIYTLGASLYYAVTGQEPTLSNARKLDNEPLIAPREYARVSSQVNDAILWAMELEPEDRPSSMEEWLQCFAPQEEDDLSSEKEVDYRQLRDFLKAQQWQEADMETYRRMLEVAGREKEGWFRVEDLKNFARTDLRTIDQLWMKYSNGHFGFSVQKQIFLDLGGKLGEYDYETEVKLARRVGWLKKDEDRDSVKRYPNDFTFNLNSHKGHLPVPCEPLGWGGGGVGSILFSRL